MDQLNNIVAYENGELDEEEVIDLFQELINSGLAWQLQGSYGRMAASLIESGYCDYSVRTASRGTHVLASDHVNPRRLSPSLRIS